MWNEEHEQYINRLNKREKETLEILIADEKERMQKDYYVKGISIRQMARRIGVTSTAVMSDILNSLEEKRLIIQKRNSAGVTIERKVNYGRIKEIEDKKKELENKPLTEREKKLQQIPKLKTAVIPYIKKVVNTEDILDIENIEEFIAVPLNHSKEESLFAFKANVGADKDENMPLGSIIISDTKAQIIPRDFVTYLNNNKMICIRRYRRGEDKGELLGKVIASFVSVTY